MTDSSSTAQAQLLQALDHHRAGRVADAAALYRKLLAADPTNADAMHLLGTLMAQSGDPTEAEQLIGSALRIKDDAALIWSNHGNALGMLGRREEAIASYDRALALEPDLIEAIYSRCGLLIGMGRAAQALTDLDSVLDCKSMAASVRHVLLTGRGNALIALGRLEEAVAVFDAAHALAPRNVDAIANRGKALKELGRHAEAIAAFEQALTLVPGHLDAILGRAHAQVLTGQQRIALDMLDRVLKVQPDNAVAHYIRGHGLLAEQRPAEAHEAFKRAADLRPDYVEAVYNCGDALCYVGRYPEAIDWFARTLELEPDHTHAVSGLANAAMQCCEWARVADAVPIIRTKVVSGVRGVAPFHFLTVSDSMEEHLVCARTFTRYACPASATPLNANHAGGGRADGRIRLGYLSSDFRRHAMAYQVAELFEVHDRDLFEVVGFSAGPDDASPIRRRIQAAFDRFHDVATLNNEDIARMIHGQRIDVVIDLNGHTAFSRIGALAWRPAPVQATYLGFPGTSGADFIDYVIADETVAPFTDQPFFTERIVHLPGCYQVSDRARTAAADAPGRAAHGLPADACVLACFNSSYKIAPGIFGVWMRILRAVPDSVLWLVRSSDAMAQNLIDAAAAHGIAASRLVFCGMVEPGAHIARHALADLFLDTLPYNSHGTGSFALWAGLPILTCRGQSFAGRVAASMLQAIGLGELVTETLEEYEALAVQLARDRQRLAALRRRLIANRDTTPLFDTHLFRRHIEAAYTTMHETALQGQQPRSFAVPQLQ